MHQSLDLGTHLLFMLDNKSVIWKDVLDYQSWTSIKVLYLGNQLISQDTRKQKTLKYK